MTTALPDVRFLRVIGRRSEHPCVLAVVDEHLVRWERDEWTCECDTEGDTCPHVETVATLLDDRVLGADR